MTDQELVLRARDGHLEAFEALVERYQRPVYSLARRLLRDATEAEDATQQAFLNAMEHLEGFREDASFRTWLMRIATNVSLKILRKRRGLSTISLDSATAPAGEGGPIPHPEFIADWRERPEDILQRKESRKMLEDGLDQLDAKYRTVFVLRDVEGFSVEETSRIVGITPGNVKVRLLRARLKLREWFTRLLGDESSRVHPAAGHGATKPAPSPAAPASGVGSSRRRPGKADCNH